MSRNTAKSPRGARPASERETASDRFEFARRHIVKQQKLEKALSQAEDALFDWKDFDEHGRLLRDRAGNTIERRPRTPEEREDLKRLEAAVVDARARLLLHENDGRNL